MALAMVEMATEPVCPGCLGTGTVFDIDGSLTGTVGEWATCVCSLTDAENAELLVGEEITKPWPVGFEDDYTAYCRWKGVMPARTIEVNCGGCGDTGWYSDPDYSAPCDCATGVAKYPGE